MNLNDVVRIKLNPSGVAILKEKHDKLAAFVAKRGGKFHEWEAPKVDDQGYYKTQLWCVMQDFGPHIRLGGEAPFETEILVGNGRTDTEEKS